MSMLNSLMLSPAQRRDLDEAAGIYCKQMSDSAYQYLEGRGIGRAQADKYRIGFVADPPPLHDAFRGRLCLPYLTLNGVVGLKFRDIDGGSDVKYMALAGMHPRLYNVNAFHKEGNHIAIVEGELDAVVMDALVGVPAIGVPGASMWFEHHPQCFDDYERIFVVCDNDVKKDHTNPGQALAKKICGTIKRATSIIPPAGQDLNEWYLAEGREAIRQRMGLGL